MGSIILVIFLFALGFWLFRPFQQVERVTRRKPRHKQYKDSRLTDLMMEKIMKAYNAPEEPESDDEEESDFDEFEEDDESSPDWSDQQPQFDSYEVEEIEARTKFFRRIGGVLEITTLLLMTGTYIAETKIPASAPFFKSTSSLLAFVRIAPIVLMALALVVRTLGSRKTPSGDRN